MKIYRLLKFTKLVFFILLFFQINFIAKSDEERIESIVDQIQIINKDLKTLERAIYKNSDISSTRNRSSNNLDEDVLTKHLLKLNDIEDQFRELTNRFEEVSFKLDKLANRVSKIQSDTQLRFSDIESTNTNLKTQTVQKKKTYNPYQEQIKPKTLEKLVVMILLICHQHNKHNQLSLLEL